MGKSSMSMPHGIRRRKESCGLPVATGATARLCRACSDGNSCGVKEAIEDSACLEWFDPDTGLTPLMIAANRPDDINEAVEIIHMLLDAGANLEAKVTAGPKAGQTALYRATVFGHCGEDDRVLMALLGRGAQYDTAAVPRAITRELTAFAYKLEVARQEGLRGSEDVGKAAGIDKRPVGSASIRSTWASDSEY